MLLLENTKSPEELAAIIGMTKFKTVRADKVYNDYKSFINSKELAEVHAGFHSKTSITELMFHYAMVVGTSVYVFYKTDGINYLKKESIGSSLDNAGLHKVITLPQGFIIDQSECFRKCESNRILFRTQFFYMTLCSVYL